MPGTLGVWGPTSLWHPLQLVFWVCLGAAVWWRVAPTSRPRALLALAGILVIYLADGGPLAILSDEYSQVAASVQQVMLALVAAPFLASAMPRRPLPGPVAYPAAFTGVVLALCRVPGLFTAGWHSDAVHALQHAVLLLGAVWMWRAAATDRPGRLFLNVVAMVPITSWLAASQRLWFPWYARAPHLLHLSALNDQRAAGWVLLGATVLADVVAYGLRFRFRAGLRWAALAALTLALIGSGCERASVAAQTDTPGVLASLTVAPSPPAVGLARLTIRLQDSQGQPLAAQQVQVQGDMTMPGMVPVKAPATDTGGGTYVAGGFRFTMGGEWLLTVKGSLPDGSPFDEHLPPLEVAS